MPKQPTWFIALALACVCIWASECLSVYECSLVTTQVCAVFCLEGALELIEEKKIISELELWASLHLQCVEYSNRVYVCASCFLAYLRENGRLQSFDSSQMFLLSSWQTHDSCVKVQAEWTEKMCRPYSILQQSLVKYIWAIDQHRLDTRFPALSGILTSFSLLFHIC